NARRTLQNAAEWTSAGAGNNLAGQEVPATGRYTANVTLDNTRLTEDQLQGKQWNAEHTEWEKRMAELEDRLKRVQNASMSQSQGPSQGGLGAAGASSPSPQPQASTFNVPLVNGRPITTGLNSSFQGSSSVGAGAGLSGE